MAELRKELGRVREELESRIEEEGEDLRSSVPAAAPVVLSEPSALSSEKAGLLNG